MATIAQIIEREEVNTEHIHLYKEGIFLKAYQYSAFQFFTQIRQFKPTKRYYKSVACDVVSLGFPSDRLTDIFKEEEINIIDEKHVCLPCRKLNAELYLKWLEMIDIQPARVEKTEKLKPSAPQGFSNDIAGTSTIKWYGNEQYTHEKERGGNIIQTKIIRKLETFAIENATPLDCMLFLSNLKSELKNI